MIPGYRDWGTILFTKGRIPGVERFGRSRAVPENAVKPVDPRKKGTNRGDDL